MERIYLDHHSTTPLLPAVREAMEPYLTRAFGNPASSVHAEGWEAAEAVERARHEVAALAGARDSEVVFTSGATESNNLAIKGAAWSAQPARTHLVTSPIEHQSVLEPARWLARRGYPLSLLPVGAGGRVDLDAVADAIDDRTVLLSVQWASSEIGTVQPVEAIARLCRERGVFFHVDAAQGLGKLPLRFGDWGIDLLSVSAHKIYGPKGVGALLIRRGVRIDPLFHGGGQERGRRSGTVNVPGVVGFGAACTAARADLDVEARRLALLRDRLWAGLRERIPGVRRNGDPAHALPNNLNVAFEGVYAQALVQELRTVAVSTGSACSSLNPEPSHVLRALGLPDEIADASLRFGLGRANTEAEIDAVVEAIGHEVARLRALSPVPGVGGPSPQS